MTYWKKKGLTPYHVMIYMPYRRKYKGYGQVGISKNNKTEYLPDTITKRV